MLLCPLAAPTQSTGNGLTRLETKRLLVGQQRHLVGRGHRQRAAAGGGGRGGVGRDGRREAFRVVT